MAKIPNGGASAVKVKLMCSYGGRIQPRLQDQQLSYVGGESKILTVDRNIKLPDIVDKLQALCSFKGDAICIKYQLPGEDLDVLISLINEDDLENMMIEYDRLQKKITPEKPVRFRLFLASVNTNDDDDDDAKQQLALDSVKAAASNPDYLFGLDKSIKDCSPSGFDLGLWSIPKAAIAAAAAGGNTCSVNLNESEKQESRELHVAANGVPALVYNLPIPAQNGGFQTGNHYGVGRMVLPVHSVNGYREQPIYFMAPAPGKSAPEQMKITAPSSGCMACGDGKVVNNNTQVRNV